MRIAMVSEHASPLAAIGDVDAGGQNVHVASLSAALAHRGHDVTVFTRRDDPELPRQVMTADGYVVHHIDAGPAARIPKDDLLPYMPGFSRQLTAAWARTRPDIAHSHFWMSGMVSQRAARSIGIPVVHTFHALGVVKRRHQGTADSSPRLRLATEARLTRRVDRIIATCSDEVFELRRMGLAGDRVDIVPCGVDLNRFTPAGLPRGDTPSSRPLRIASVSRLVPRKGIDDAITAVSMVPGTQLFIAGGPQTSTMDGDPEVARLRALIGELGVSDRVHLLGPVPRDEVASLMRSCDALLALPWYEPFGITPIEASASGLPVVATAVGGMIDSIVHEVTGLHVPPRDPHSAAEAITRLRDDPILRERLGRDGARRAHRKYGWDRIAELTEASYGRVISNSSRTPEPALLEGSAS